MSGLSQDIYICNTQDLIKAINSYNEQLAIKILLTHEINFSIIYETKTFLICACENKLNNLSEDGADIGKYMFIFDLYNYFSNYLIMNDVNHYKICSYLQLVKNDTDEITFLSLLDSNNKRLIKLTNKYLRNVLLQPTTIPSLTFKTITDFVEIRGNTRFAVIKFNAKPAESTRLGT